MSYLNNLLGQANVAGYNPSANVGQQGAYGNQLGMAYNGQPTMGLAYAKQPTSVQSNTGQPAMAQPTTNRAKTGTPQTNTGQVANAQPTTGQAYTNKQGTYVQQPYVPTRQQGTYVQNPYVPTQQQGTYVQNPYVPGQQAVIQPNLKPPKCSNRTNMHVLNTQRLVVDFADSSLQKQFSLPRRYSFSRFGQPLLFGAQNQQYSPNPYLYIGSNYKNLGGDTIYGSWNKTQYGGFYTLNITVPWYPNSSPTTQICRNISRAIEAIVYGDRYVIESNPRLMQASIVVKYLTANSNSDSVEAWGNVRDFLY